MSFPPNAWATGSFTLALWHPTSASVAISINPVRICLERKSHPAEKEMPRLVTREIVAAGKEDAVAERDRDIAGDLPIQINVRLDAQVFLIAGDFIDRGVAAQLVVDEEIRTHLQPPQRRDI